jgi:hypothetical protein
MNVMLWFSFLNSTTEVLGWQSDSVFKYTVSILPHIEKSTLTSKEHELQA